MSEEWDSYMVMMGDDPASIFLDLSLHAQAPITEMPYRANVLLDMRQPRPDGLSSQEESHILYTIEDAIAAVLPGPKAARYAGRVTVGGLRDFICYLADPTDWDDRVQRALAAFPDYSFKTITKHEPDWNTYRDVLFPEKRDRQQMSNRRVCRLLNERGDALATTRTVSHWAYFPTAGARDSFVRHVAADGFEAAPSQGPSQDGQYPALLSRTDLPCQPDIDAVTWSLVELAERYGGSYDGWETEVVAG